MTSAKLASDLGVDKSVVSRWLSGSVNPSAHNLSRLSVLVAGRNPRFRMFDWERDVDSLAELFGADAQGAGVQRPASAPPKLAGGLSLAVWEQAITTTAQRGRAYEGFYKLLRPTDIPAAGFAYDYSMVRMTEQGLLSMKLASFGTVAEGWLLPLHNQLYCVLASATSGGLTFAILNGLASSKVDALDGIALGSSNDPGRTPTALGIYCERIGDLSGDPEADQKHFEELARECPQPGPQDVPLDLVRHLLPDFGPEEEAKGGDVVMQIKRSRSLSRSAPFQAQIAAGPGRAADHARPDGTAPFSEKLKLVLKLLTLSSAQLAAAVEVDKSVVSRWLSGGVAPSAHNLARLTSVIAARAPGFTMLDWERPPESLAQLFGADLASISALNAADKVLALNIWDQILATSALRGRSYEGFFRITRPSVLEPDSYIQEYGLIEPNENGLWRFRLGSFGALLDGWMLPLHDQLYFIAADTLSGVLLFGIFNGVGSAKVDVVDGLTLSPNLDVSRSPTAMGVISESVEDLSGDPEADEARFQEYIGMKRMARPADVDEAVRKRLARSGGYSYAQAGGDLILQMPLANSLARPRGFSRPGRH